MEGLNMGNTAIKALMECRQDIVEEIHRIREHREAIDNEELYSMNVGIEKELTRDLADVDEALIAIQAHQYKQVMNQN
jgi:hypothetical protein